MSVKFAKDEKVKRILQHNWDKTTRYYVALVEGKVTNQSTIKGSILCLLF